MSIRRLHPIQPASFDFTPEESGLGQGSAQDLSGTQAGFGGHSHTLARPGAERRLGDQAHD